jgi:alginate O-acetyltransferase complex protein AlgI
MNFQTTRGAAEIRLPQFQSRALSPVLWAILLVISSALLVYCLTTSATALLLFALNIPLVVITWGLSRTGNWLKRAYAGWILVLMILLVCVKLPGSAISPIQWVGISYLIFRLIHFSIDARNGRLGDPTLAETLIFALHPATLTAGPIDRIQRSVKAQRAKSDWPRHLNAGIWRLFMGLFKKLVLVNICFLITEHFAVPKSPNQPVPIVWLWLIVSSFYLYFDFSGYTDLAIGAAHLMGFDLPENFANPYLKTNLAQFWQAWHITLSNWLRDYIFFPVSRGLLRRFGNQFAAPILLISHLLTMIVCGLWHGIAGGFVAWGIWHGIGLFINSQMPALRRRIPLPVLPAPLAIGATFLFVTLGWVFFLTDFNTALHIYARLFGM